LHLSDGDGPVNQDIQVNIKQVWKRKDNGLLGRVSGLIFLEPRRVIWRALPNQGEPDAYEIITETEFKKQFEDPRSDSSLGAASFIAQCRLAAGQSRG
jgi:hypothetical protein